jgi:hypothetical protein
MALNPGFCVAAEAPTKSVAKSLAKKRLLQAVYDIYSATENQEDIPTR